MAASPDTLSAPSKEVTSEALKVPRLYQAELLEEAKKRNIIIRADTGTGKTLVALLLMKWMASQHPLHHGTHMIQAFLVPTRPLVYQQAELIEAQTGLRVHSYTGDIQPEFWKINKWHAELENVDVIVCTAQIFYDLISKGFWNFEHVSLLVFDEAHHCRKSHVYNQIMQVHYHRLAQDPAKRLPKILGLTASPIWAYRSLVKAEKDIKTLQSDLAAQLFEVKANTADVNRHTFRPNEVAVYFDPPAPPEKDTSPPWDRVNALLQKHAGDKFIATLTHVSTELGSFAHVLCVIDWLRNLVVVGNKNSATSTSLLDPAYRQHIEDTIKPLEALLDPTDVPDDQLSSKVKALIQILVGFKEKDDDNDFHGIVFVERRQHAQLLYALLSRSETLRGFIKPIALTGHGGNQDSDALGPRMDSKAQNKTVEKFRSGEINLTIATNVAEEGLDFRACRVVIRFDEITTWKGYIQSRGRARASNSEYVVMLPRGAPSKYLEFLGKEDQLKSELYNRPDDEVIGEGEVESTPQLICKLSDGKDSILTYSAATSLLNDVCQLIPHDDFLPPPKPEYETSATPEGFISQVTLPPMAALHPSQRVFKGTHMPTKKESRRSAAFQACDALRKLGVLNDHFLPQREDKKADMTDADGRAIKKTLMPEQITATCPNPYGDLWTSSEVWLHRLSFGNNDSQIPMIGLLCANHLRIPGDLRIYDHQHESKPVSIINDDAVQMKWDKAVSEANLAKLESFTQLVIQVAINRRFYDGQLLFLVAPLIEGSMEIDWSLVETPLAPLSSVEEISSYTCIVAPIRPLHHRIYTAFSSCEDLTAASPPADVPSHPNIQPFRKMMSKFNSLGHFYAVRFEIPPELYDGMLLYVESTFKATDNLLPSSKKMTTPYRVLIPFTLCRGSNISPSLWHSFSLLPSLTRLIHDSCQTQSLLDKLELTGIHINLAVEALTQPGVGVPWDYQTLETVGDAFLKLATSVHIYLNHSRKGEGDMSIVRSKSVDNAYLRQKAFQANLAGYVLSQRYRTERFRAAQLEDGRALETGEFERKIPRRVLSDIVEALLGAGFLSGGVPLALKIGTALDLCFGGTVEWSQRPWNIGIGNGEEKETSNYFASMHESLQRKIGYVFKEKLLLIQALTHRSANSFLTNCYEREEWLGDAVIDLWIIEHVYRRFPGVTAEQLTLARARMVSNGSLGFLAIKKLKLHKVLHHQSESFNKSCAEAKKAIEPYTKIAEFYKDVSNLFVVFDPPKILNDALEAIVGAIFIDSGFDLKTVYHSLDLIFEDVLPGVNTLETRDPLSRLLRLRDKYQCTALNRDNKIVQEPDPDSNGAEYMSVRICVVTLHDQEIATGRHPSSASVAEQRAALEALRILEDSAGDGQCNSKWTRCNCKVIAAAAAAATPGKSVQSTKVMVGPVGGDQQLSSSVAEQVSASSLQGRKNKKKRAKMNRRIRTLQGASVIQLKSSAVDEKEEGELDEMESVVDETFSQSEDADQTPSSAGTKRELECPSPDGQSKQRRID